MGLFSKRPKSSPMLKVEGIELVLHRQTGHEFWQFTYRGAEFMSYKAQLTLPKWAELDAILDAVKSLKVEMRRRLEKDLKLDDGESYMVNVQDFAPEKTFVVSWAGGASWGDMGVDFTIRAE